MKIQAITDWHLGSPSALGAIEDFEKLLLEKLKLGPVCLLGDNFDFANMLEEEIEAHMRFFKHCLMKRGFLHLNGNHERISRSNDVILPCENVVMAHGDFEFWGDEKALAYRSKQKGASNFKRKFIIPMIESYEEDRTPKLKKDFLKRAVLLAKSKGCHTYICGHKHPTETIDIVHDGIRIVVLKRGFSEVNI